MVRSNRKIIWDLEKVLAVGLVIVAIFVIVVAFVEVADKKEACEKRGGHMVSVYKSSLCVSSDGRILE